MNCKLCKQDRPLRNSHIIPEFFYREGYDEKHRYIALYDGIKEYGYIQKGLREKLLCQDCEQFLNDNYEKYFNDFWYKRENMPRKAKGDIYWVRGIDYKMAKLFLLSILWRAGVATGKDFTNITLGRHEECLRNMILSGDAGHPDQYQIFAVLLLMPETKDICDSFIMSPLKSRFEARHLYIFTFGGCVWNYVVSSHPCGYPVDNFSLAENGTIKMPTIYLDKFPPVNKFISAQADVFKRAQVNN